MKTITALLILLSAMPAAAVGVETLIAPMAEPLQAGQKTTISIYIHNTGKVNVVVDLPDRLTCLIKSKTKTTQVAAYPETSLPGSSATIMPMSFLKVRYVFLVEDTSYKPELFLVSPNIKTSIPGNRGFFLQGGFQHESNGRGGDLSRSTNFLYLKPMLIFYDPKSKFGLYAAPGSGHTWPTVTIRTRI